MNLDSMLEVVRSILKSIVNKIKNKKKNNERFKEKYENYVFIVLVKLWKLYIYRKKKLYRKQSSHKPYGYYHKKYLLFSSLILNTWSPL
jgi:hypothetical protein